MNSAFFIALRRLRAPLIFLILIFAIAITGLVAIPGTDAAGRPWTMDFLNALYVISYTATTIGFGEIPHAFSPAQRLWVIFCIFLSVIGWTYALSKLFGVFQDRGFRQALLTERFEHRVERLAEPFFLVCGYGETGQLLVRALDRLHLRCVVLDREQRRIDELDLEDYQSSVPSFAADVRDPGALKLAGLTHPLCRAVIAVTGDDRANLAVAIAARLLSPAISAVCRASHAEIAANMTSFGTRYIIDPFETFGEHLALAIRSPGSYQLLQWLTGLPGTRLTSQQEPPCGPWIICGYGRFGRAVIRHGTAARLKPTIVDRHPRDPGVEFPWVRGTGTEADTLRAAGIETAVGIVAGTDDDIDNLSIVMTARELNPDLFVVLRQNRTANQALFQAFAADFTAVTSEIIAHECLAVVTAPLLTRFLTVAKAEHDAWADAVIARLIDALSDEVPIIWQWVLDGQNAPGLTRALVDTAIPLDVLRRHPENPGSILPCVPLLLVRNGQNVVMPEWTLVLRPGDHLLFAGRPEARPAQQAVIQDARVAANLLHGQSSSDGWVYRYWKAARRKSGALIE